MKKYSCAVNTGILESKRCIVYANSKSEAKSKVDIAGFRLTYSAFTDETYSMLDSYIDAKERDGDFIVIR